MIKKLTLLICVIILLGALSAALVVRKLPALVVSTLRQTLERDVTIESLHVRFPFAVQMDRLLVSEKAPFEGEPAFYVERANAAIDPWAFFTAKRIVFLDVELIRPRLIFRKQLGKVYHAFRIRPDAADPGAEGRDAASLPAERRGVPPLRFDRILLRDGEVQLMDYDADSKGFVIRLLRLTAELKNVALPSDGTRLKYSVEGLLDQGRDTPPGRLKLSGEWTRETLDGNTGLQLTGIFLPYFKPYYRMVSPSLISDGELDLVATSAGVRGILTANSKWTLRRLTFEKSEADDMLLGFDANVIQNILTGGSGSLSLDLALSMDLRDRSVPFRDVLRKSLRQSIRATFTANFDSALKNTVNQIASQNSELLKKQNWKALLKKNKIEDVVNQVMNPQ